CGSRGSEYSSLGRFRPGYIGLQNLLYGRFDGFLDYTVSPGALSGGAADSAMLNEKERRGTKEEDLQSQ
ncbi:hypothetical protein L249_5525, partial [Ophiocordyceps polyrhachis-furcata BCC 54312]